MVGILLTHPECNTNDSLSSVSFHPHLEHLLTVLDIDDPDGPVEMSYGDHVDGG
jgi:hypothetical protein